jgi:GNAT superfamily N-acetyltransferase
MKIDVHVESPISTSARARQLSAMFDVPPAERARLDWRGDLPIDELDWTVGLIVGPSGSGKSVLLRELFGEMPELNWGAASVVDDFLPGIAMRDLAETCQAVGFNTVPAWLRPYDVLSTGERFRVEIARRLLETPKDRPIVMDEFSSVVDRQVAQIGAYAVQRYVRKYDRQFVAASCHYDIIDWLLPDWTFEPATMTFTRRFLQPGAASGQRPPLAVTLERVSGAAWRLFAPYHYLTAELNPAARCYVLFVGDRPASFAGLLHRPHAYSKTDVVGISRIVTLPDWQGLGLAFVLMDTLGAMERVRGKRLHNYPAHPAFVRSMARSNRWRLTKQPGTFAPRSGKTSSLGGGKFGARPNATFEYVGPEWPDRAQAVSILTGPPSLRAAA